MKIAFGSWTRGNDPKFYTPSNTASGYENVAASCDGRWRVLNDEKNNNYDLLLCCMPNGHDNIEKSPKWGKLFLLEEAGFGVINTHWFYEKLLNTNCDGVLVHSKKLLPFFESLNKKAIPFNPPYPFLRAQKTNKKTTIPKKVCLNMSRLKTSEANIAGTIRLCQLLPDFTFISYSGDHADINRIIKAANIKNWNTLPDKQWEDYLHSVSDCAIFASLDNRHTWGRFQLDAAALGKICVGAYSGSQELIYPKEYTTEPTEIQKLADLIKNLESKTFTPPPHIPDILSHDTFKKFISTI